MPHFTIEYSANLDGEVDMAALCDELRRAAIETGVFPTTGIRVRAIRCEICSIADGDPKHGFIDISARLREGRDMATRKRATDAIFAAAEALLAPVLAARPLALSFEMRNIDPELSPKTNSIPDHMAGEG